MVKTFSLESAAKAIANHPDFVRKKVEQRKLLEAQAKYEIANQGPFNVKSGDFITFDKKKMVTVDSPSFIYKDTTYPILPEDCAEVTDTSQSYVIEAIYTLLNEDGQKVSIPVLIPKAILYKIGKKVPLRGTPTQKHVGRFMTVSVQNGG